MKIFFWTSVFWILAAFIFLFISGRGGLMPPVFDQSYLVSRIPNTVNNAIYKDGFNNGLEGCQATSTQTVSEPTIEGTMTGANVSDNNTETNIADTTPTTLPAQLPLTVEEFDLSDLRIDLAGVREEIKAAISEATKTITAKCGSESSAQPSAEPTAEEIAAQKEKQKAELQAQIDSLKYQMETI
ncbi:hypothetical protein AGMMS50249_0370 [candidate division SR1 bacterium]|nr:hypothetical protein AGMMS50249_0370 [candidate division SR1 bacterium]